MWMDYLLIHDVHLSKPIFSQVGVTGLSPHSTATIDTFMLITFLVGVGFTRRAVADESTANQKVRHRTRSAMGVLLERLLGIQ
jgi:uncharacterized membrane protein